MNEVKLTIESFDEFVAQSLDAAKRLDRGDREPESAVLAFDSMEAFLRLMTPNRWVLLRTLRQTGPASIRALAQALKRDYRGAHADVTALLGVGLIERDDSGKIFVPWSRIAAEMELDSAA